MAGMEKLYELFPKAVSCESNHTSRPYRQAYAHGIPRAFLRDYKDFMRAPPGWHWKSSTVIDGVRYEHGDPMTGAQAAFKAATGNMQSTVIGHVHAFAGICWIANPRFLLFGFNCGCLIDRRAYAFSYGAKQKSKPILGCGIIADAIPTFLPMILNGSGRWTGKV